ncbi:MAG TPA: tRNA (adenosine(37)-N6)-dimethylallyltransferase MiaA [Clostridiales bacterium]|nr:tRNA (adenosine(37)-N6)-dimethylallyltransferase MiaA [Clostridiales bacterium]
MEKKPLIVIVGPTAVGKTRLSIKLAHRIDGEIISADSMQVYKYMNIGSAKPTEKEQDGIKHYLIDEIHPTQAFSVALFNKLANKYIDVIVDKGKLPIVVGGTGLYINSLTHTMNFTPIISNGNFRKCMKEKASREGTISLHNKLKKVDPTAADKIHHNDLKRIIRALEVYHFTGKPISYYQQLSKKQEIPYNLVQIGLTMDRKQLYQRIDKRVDIMMEQGLLEEVKYLKSLGCNRETQSMQGLGYKELLDYLDDKCTLDQAVDIIKRNTRRYAKRQLTWFKKDKRIFWIDITNIINDEAVVNLMMQHINKIIPLTS